MKMKDGWILFLAALLAALPTAAQSSASAQTQGTGSTSADAQAGKTKAKASTDTSADASAKASKKGAKADAKANNKNSAQASSGENSLDLGSGSTLEATLTKALDVRKNKVGDEVVAKVTRDVKSDGKVVLAKGSKLLGHVTEAKARGKGESESALGIAFDRAVTKDGQEHPVNVAVQAIAAAESAASAAVDDTSLMTASNARGVAAGSATAAPSRPAGSSGGGVLGGVGSTVSGATNTVGSVVGSAPAGAVGGTVSSATNAAGSVTGSSSGGAVNAVGNLTSESNGVIGLQGLNLSSAASSANESGAMLTSTTRNVHLDGGTRMILRAAGAAEVKPKP
ncbi:MAG TPA: hypothetical protein VGQ11_01365 [Candidatus Acidoferrales bacterium]|jgi:hypothetical protein|nr:hypothetical protein [Candidatus Acidoferrales bacterium]